MATSPIEHECGAGVFGCFTGSGGLDFEPLTGFEPRPCWYADRGCTALTDKGLHVGLYDKDATYAICPEHDELFLRELCQVWSAVHRQHQARERAEKAERRAARAAKRAAKAGS